jgi:hypothetical protein
LPESPRRRESGVPPPPRARPTRRSRGRRCPRSPEAQATEAGISEAQPSLLRSADLDSPPGAPRSRRPPPPSSSLAMVGSKRSVWFWRRG